MRLPWRKIWETSCTFQGNHLWSFASGVLGYRPVNPPLPHKPRGYSRAEEALHSVSHGAGFLGALIGAPFLVNAALRHGGGAAPWATNEVQKVMNGPADARLGLAVPPSTDGSGEACPCCFRSGAVPRSTGQATRRVRALGAVFGVLCVVLPWGGLLSA